MWYNLPSIYATLGYLMPKNASPSSINRPFFSDKPNAKKARHSKPSDTVSIVPYKRKNGNIDWVAPRESYLRALLANLTAPINDCDYTIKPYRGSKNSTDPRRQMAFEQMRCLYFIHEAGIPDMQNGHVMIDNLMHRALFAEMNNQEEMLGGIYFTINLDTRECFIEALHVHSEQHGQNIGSHLLHLAVIFAVTYGCDQVYLASNNDALPFYIKNGFIIVDDESLNEDSESEEQHGAICTLDLFNHESRNTFMERAGGWLSATSLHFIESLITLYTHLQPRLGTNSTKERIGVVNKVPVAGVWKGNTRLTPFTSNFFTQAQNSDLTIEPLTDKDLDNWNSAFDANL